MKPSFPWNYRRILPIDGQPTLAANSPFSEAVDQCRAERHRSLQLIRGGCAALVFVFGLVFLVLGRLSVATIGPDTVMPTNPQSTSGYQARVDALARENTLLIKELQKAQSAIEDLQELASKRAPEFDPTGDDETSALLRNSPLTAIANAPTANSR